MANLTKKDKLQRQEIFLKVFAEQGTIRGACKELKEKGISYTRQGVQHWLKNDSDFSKRFEETKSDFVEKLEDIAHRLVKEMGDNLDYKANPTLLIFLLNANNPEKYRGVSDTSSDAREVLAGFRKMASSTVVKVEEPKKIQTVDYKTVIEYEEEKKALSEKFGSLNNDNENGK